MSPLPRGQSPLPWVSSGIHPVILFLCFDSSQQFLLPTSTPNPARTFRGEAARGPALWSCPLALWLALEFRKTVGFPRNGEPSGIGRGLSLSPVHVVR